MNLWVIDIKDIGVMLILVINMYQIFTFLMKETMCIKIILEMKERFLDSWIY